MPLALPLYRSGQLQPYLPRQLQTWLSDAAKGAPVTNSDAPLSPQQLLDACDAHQYSTEIISLDPLVVYINNFTSHQEAEELINIGCALPSHLP